MSQFVLFKIKELCSPVIGLASLLAMLGGCAVGPDFKSPAAPKAEGYTVQALPAQTASAAEIAGGAAQKFDPASVLPADWWSLFHAPQLDALVERALKHSPTLEAAHAMLRQAQQNVIAQKGYFYPNVSASYSPSRNMIAGNGGGGPGLQNNGDVLSAGANQPVLYNFHVAQLSVGYVPDVFGGNRRQVESLQAQLEAQHFQLEAAYITLAANVVAAALQEATLRAQIKAMDEVVKFNHENLDILHKQLSLGYVAGIDVAGQEAAAAQAEQMLIPLNRQLEQTRDLLRALVGKLPNEELDETFSLDDLSLPQDLPLSLPSQLVEQRPDIRAAQAQWHAATAQVGVARAGRLPQFAITANVGGMAPSPDWMFRNGGEFFNIIGSITMPIFDGGTLKAREQAARENLKQVAANYRQTVITAFQNVADVLHAIRFDADYLQAALRTERAMQETAELTRMQYELGYASYQSVLLAEQNYQQASVNLVQARATRFGDTVALFQALGGGWWNRKAAEPSVTGPGKEDAN